MTMTKHAAYRVIKYVKVGFGSDPAVSRQVIWQGDDTDVLSKRFPPSVVRGADPLGNTEIEDGHTRYEYVFEQLVDGEWQEIEDPRQRLTPMTFIESQILADNRHHFPW